jgi:hypothetical protein
LSEQTLSVGDSPATPTDALWLQRV